MKTPLVSILLLSVLFLSEAKGSGQLDSKKGLPPKEQARLLLEGSLSLDEVTDPSVWTIIEGGDIIGNGTGISEIRFFETYQSIETLMKRCLEQAICPFAQADMLLLRKIRAVAQENITRRPMLLFISESEYPNFFLDSEYVGPRTAKTGFRAGLPIFINRDHLYNNGQPSISVKEILAILIHELGHQTGERGHTRLDAIGAAFSNWAVAKATSIQMTAEDQLAEFQLINPVMPNAWPVAWWSWGQQSLNVRLKLKNSARCKDPTLQPIGATLSNVHWRREVSSQDQIVFGVSAWVTLYCMGDDSLIYDEDQSVDFGFTTLKTGGEGRVSTLSVRWNSENTITQD